MMSEDMTRRLGVEATSSGDTGQSLEIMIFGGRRN